MNYDINIRHLEYFTTVAKLGSINKAAQSLFISQPSLGKMIRDLEDKLGVKLFYRSHSGVALTAEGMDFLARAERILKEVDGFTIYQPSETDHSIPLAVSMTRFSHIMESFSELMVRHREDTSFSHRLYEGTSDDVIEDVCAGRANVGVFHFDSRKRKETEKLLHERGLTYHRLAQAEPHIVLSKQHPLIQKKLPITLSTLSDYGFLWYLGQCDEYIYRLFSDSGQDMEQVRSKMIYLSSRATLMYLISISDFYTIGIHGFAMQETSYQTMSIPIPNSGFSLEFGYITPLGEPLSGITEEFIEDLTARLRET